MNVILVNKAATVHLAKHPNHVLLMRHEDRPVSLRQACLMYFIENSTASEAGVLADLYADWVEAESGKCNYSFKQSVMDSIK
jgi:hypothetical protein